MSRFRNPQHPSGTRREGRFRPSLRRFAFLALLALAALFPPAVSADGFSPLCQWPDPASSTVTDNGWHPGARQALFVGNRMLPLKEMGGRWNGPIRFDARNLAYSRSIVDAHASSRDWDVAVAYRFDMALIGNRDTAEALSLLRGKRDLPAGRRFQVQLDANGFAGEQLRIARRWAVTPIDGLSLGIAAGVLHGERIQYGSLGGELVATGPRAYDYALAAEYAYDINYLYDGSPVSRKDRDGYGHAFDLALRYENDGVTASVRGEDLFGRVYWRDVPVTNATANSGGAYFDSSGYIHYNPLISGFEGKRDLTQKLPEKGSVEIGKRWARFRIDAGCDAMKRIAMPRGGAGYRFDDAGGWWSVGYDIHFRMAGIRYEGKRGNLALYSDSLSLRTTRALGFRGEITW